MGTIGSILKEAREKQNKKIEDIVEATKISRANIVAIESENFYFCPGHSYTRAFIKIYAEELSIDAEELTSMYDQKVSDKNRYAGKEKSDSKIGVFPFLYEKKIILTVTICFFTGLFFFGYKKHDAGKKNQDITIEPVKKPKTKSYETPEIIVESKRDMNVPKLLKVKNNGVAEEGLISKEDVLEDTNKFVVRFVARDLTWIKIVADGEESEIMLRAGDSHTKSAVQSMRVRMGNSGGVSLFYNNIPLGSPGKPGEPVNILFPEAAKNLKTFE